MEQYLQIKRVSAHLLKVFLTSVKDYVFKLNNPDQERKKYFELGKQVHMSLLEPVKFEETYHMSTFDQSMTPATEQQKAFCTLVASGDKATDAYAKTYKTERKSPKKVEEEAQTLIERFDAYINYLKELNTGKIVLPKSLADKLIEAKTTILNHKKANELLGMPAIEFANDAIKYYNELEILWEFKAEYAIVECKSKPDRIIVDTKNKTIKLIDLKTTSNLYDFKSTIIDYGYDMQLAFYWLALTYWFLKEFPTENITDYKQETYIVVLKTVGSAECKVLSFTEDNISKAVSETVIHLNRISWHVANDKWDYSKEYYEGDGVEII